MQVLSTVPVMFNYWVSIAAYCVCQYVMCTLMVSLLAANWLLLLVNMFVNM